jgi:beta-lactamase class A
MNQEIDVPYKFWRRKISPLFPLIFLFAGICFFAFALFSKAARKNNLVPVVVEQPCPQLTNYRMNDLQFAHPLVLSDDNTESADLQNLKMEITDLIESKKSTGEIETAAIYVSRLNDGHWFSINGSEGFNCGSLLKVPIMMTYLRESEKRQGYLETKLNLSPNVKVPPQTFNEGNIVPGRSYTIKELIYYMVTKSDNYATLLLNQNISTEDYANLFSDIGLPRPDVTNRNYTVTIQDYSKFLRVLYNGSYVGMDQAEMALKMMTQTTFREGMLKTLSPGVTVAHKFGEWGEEMPGALHQLHEAGIVYFENNPLLVTVMTKGRDVQRLPAVISHITQVVFERMEGKKLKS